VLDLELRLEVKVNGKCLQKEQNDRRVTNREIKKIEIRKWNPE
jgi:hypothetical protein